MQVFIISYDKATDIPHGFVRQKHDKAIWNKYSDIGRYVEKDIAQTSNAMQQIIPYTIIRNSDGKFFITTFESKDDIIMSMGFGDNLNYSDGTSQPLFKGAVRTLLEEVSIEYLQPLRHIGTVRDVISMQKYLGYVFLMDDVSDDVKLTNKSLTSSWLTKDELIENYNKFGAWSKHVINYLVDHTF